MAEKLSPWCKKAKIAMIQKDIGVSDMAEKLGNNRSYISSVLNGRVVSPPIRKRISDYLNIRLQTMLREIGKRQKHGKFIRCLLVCFQNG